MERLHTDQMFFSEGRRGKKEIANQHQHLFTESAVDQTPLFHGSVPYGILNDQTLII